MLILLKKNNFFDISTFAILVILLSFLFCGSCKQPRVPRARLKESINDVQGVVFTDVSEMEAKEFVGCGQNKKSKKKFLTDRELKNLRTLPCEKEARLSDIPIPLGAKPMDEFLSDPYSATETVVGYHSDRKIEDLFSFYLQEMERLGWQTIASFDGNEKSLNFQKPSKFCSVSIRKDQELSKIIIFSKK